MEKSSKSYKTHVLNSLVELSQLFNQGKLSDVKYKQGKHELSVELSDEPDGSEEVVGNQVQEQRQS